MATQRDTQAETQLRQLAEPCAAAHGVEIVDVQVKGHTGSRLVRLVVDADGGIDVDTCAALSRDVGTAFDRADAVTGRYTLQVTSPGVDRPLRTARDFARSVGRSVRVVTRPHAPLPAELFGVVMSVGADDVTLEVDGGAVTVPLGQVDHARVQLPW